MNVRNCRSCGRLFNYVGGPPICQECAKALEKKFQKVREYVRDHPDVPVSTVSEEMDVSVKQIRQWVREERLEFSEGVDTGLTCERCGKTIRTGRWCESCKDKVQSDLDGAKAKRVMPSPKKEQKDKERMRYLDR